MVVSVIIPTYNGAHLLPSCLEAVEKSLTGYNGTSTGHRSRLVGRDDRQTTEVIVVDNGSTDETDQLITDWNQKHDDRKVIYHRLKTNQGFTGACNAGARLAKGKYLLFLNNDCLVGPTTVDSLLRAVDSYDWVMTQPVVNDHQGGTENIGYVVDLKYGKAQVIVSEEEFKYWDSENPDPARYVYGLSGTCLLMDREIFANIGMFDPSFHSYLEDIDLSLRLRRAGHAFGPTLDTEVTHAHRATSRLMGCFKQKRDLSNWIRIIAKDYTIGQKLRYLPWLALERGRNLSGVAKCELAVRKSQA